MRGYAPAFQPDAGRRVVREVVVGLIRVDRRDEHDVGGPLSRTVNMISDWNFETRGQHREVHARGPGGRHVQLDRGRPRARDHPGLRHRDARGLGGSVERTEVLDVPSAVPLVVAEAIDVDRVRLVLGVVIRRPIVPPWGRSSSGVPLDIESPVVRDPVARPRDVPAVGAGQPVLRNDRVRGRVRPMARPCAPTGAPIETSARQMATDAYLRFTPRRLYRRRARVEPAPRRRCLLLNPGILSVDTPAWERSRSSPTSPRARPLLARDG